MNSKEKYTQIARDWLEKFLMKHYSKEYNIKVIIPKGDIAKTELKEIKEYPSYSLMDFSSDVIGILIPKKGKDIKLVLLNRSPHAISVKEIGEMNLYSKIVNPERAFLVSLRGLPNEVNNLLLNEEICSSLLNYGNKSIIVLRLDEKGEIDKKTIFPRKFKNFF
jgi:hypothetical protein